MRVNPNDYMSIDIIDAAYSEQDKLRRLMLDILDRIVILGEPDTGEREYTIPFPDLINIIERNIDKLTAGGFTPTNMLPTADWLGELSDRRRLSYIDVNRWFESVEQITALAYSVAYMTPITGTFCTGTNRTSQLIRRAS